MNWQLFDTILRVSNLDVNPHYHSIKSIRTLLMHITFMHASICLKVFVYRNKHHHLIFQVKFLISLPNLQTLVFFLLYTMKLTESFCLCFLSVVLSRFSVFQIRKEFSSLLEILYETIFFHPSSLSRSFRNYLYISDICSCFNTDIR